MPKRGTSYTRKNCKNRKQRKVREMLALKRKWKDRGNPLIHPYEFDHEYVPHTLDGRVNRNYYELFLRSKGYRVHVDVVKVGYDDPENISADEHAKNRALEVLRRSAPLTDAQFTWGIAYRKRNEVYTLSILLQDQTVYDRFVQFEIERFAQIVFKNIVREHENKRCGTKQDLIPVANPYTMTL